MATAIPPSFVRTMTELHADAGVEWLRRLPELLTLCARRWSLTLDPPFPNLTYNYVAPALRADGTHLVLKVGYPTRELWSEIDALRAFDGHGMVRLLESDRMLGALLLERLEPGTPLSALTDDSAATSIAALVIQALHRPPPEEHPFRSLTSWTGGLLKLRPHFGGTTGPFPPHLVERALALRTELLSSAGETVLLHGDLHQGNILATTRDHWLALDPKGVVGDPVYEVATWLYNPVSQMPTWPDARAVVARRVDQFAAELRFDRQRIIQWGIVQAVLSAWWNAEGEGHGWEPALAVAEILTQL